MKKEIIATYNMSFSSDLGTDSQFASEALFLNTNKSLDRRLYWKNALKMLKEFITEKDPIAIGLQEMNLTFPGDLTLTKYPFGSFVVNEMLNDINYTYGKRYIQVCAQVKGSFGFPALSIILDTGKLGCVTDFKIVDQSEGAGRPFLMVKTMNNYYLFNIHGTQNPNLSSDMEGFNEVMIESNRNFLTKEATKFINKRVISDIFVMGDFNDRYDALREFYICGKVLTYKGESPYSCCHNWDSSCKKSRYKSLSKGYGTCEIPEDWKVRLKPENKSKWSMDEEGLIKNYRYKGDKIFGLLPVSPLKIYRHDTRRYGSSTQSDHEMVYGIFSCNI